MRLGTSRDSGAFLGFSLCPCCSNAEQRRASRDWDQERPWQARRAPPRAAPPHRAVVQWPRLCTPSNSPAPLGARCLSRGPGRPPAESVTPSPWTWLPGNGIQPTATIHCCLPQEAGQPLLSAAAGAAAAGRLTPAGLAAVFSWLYILRAEMQGCAANKKQGNSGMRKTRRLTGPPSASADVAGLVRESTGHVLHIQQFPAPLVVYKI